jgi:hypothetical protein
MSLLCSEKYMSMSSNWELCTDVLRGTRLRVKLTVVFGYLTYIQRD